MKKIPSLYSRDFANDPSRVTDKQTPGTEWVTRGEGVATRKRDGTACMVRGGKLFARYDCKQGKTPPDGFEPCQDPDEITGHWPGWVSVNEQPQFWAHRKAWQETLDGGAQLPDGTYELCGPKVNGNPERLDALVFFRHGAEVVADAPTNRGELAAWFTAHTMEGIVWHHPDGRMVKIKSNDVGVRW